MDTLVVDSVYEDGIIKLENPPPHLKRARVRVTFLPDANTVETEAERRWDAGERLLASMRQGLDFGGEKFNREEIYEERIRELESRQDKSR